MVHSTRKTKLSNKKLGALGELHARRYLKRSGLRLLERNWRCRLGEIDIIVRDGREIVFVEVKTKLERREQNPYLFENITPKKRTTLSRLAELYIDRQFPGRIQPPFRIDVVGVLLAEADYSLLSVDHVLRAI